MKSILYVGATLMIGASIYGFVDYKNTSHKKEFTDMYVVENKKEPVLVMDEKNIQPVVNPLVKKEPIISDRSLKESNRNEKKVLDKEKGITEDEVILPVKPISEDESIATNGTKTIEKPVVSIDVPADNTIEKKVVKKKRKISSRLFSRAPIREDDELELIQPAKKDGKKTENKGQL